MRSIVKIRKKKSQTPSLSTGKRDINNHSPNNYTFESNDNMHTACILIYTDTYRKNCIIQRGHNSKVKHRFMHVPRAPNAQYALRMSSMFGTWDKFLRILAHKSTSKIQNQNTAICQNAIDLNACT